MRCYVVLLLVLGLGGCTALNVEHVDVDHPEVNIGSKNDVDVAVDATANVDATATVESPVAPTPAADEQPGEAEPVVTPEAKRLVAPELAAAEPEPAAAEPEPAPCADDDSDGVCNEVDVCPAGADTDADNNGYADACEQVLWEGSVYLSASVDLHDNFVAGRPAVVVLESTLGSDCYLDGVGQGFVGLVVPQLAVHEQTTVRVDRPTIGRGGKLVECLEAGVQLQTLGAFGSVFDNYTGTDAYDGIFTARRQVPVSFAGKHVTYFETDATLYNAAQAVPYGTHVGQFSAVLRVRGY